MTEQTKLDIIKGALLLEHRGRALYKSAAETTERPEVKDLFHFLVEEENHHVEILNRQFSYLRQGRDMEFAGESPVGSGQDNPVLTSKVVQNISGAGYEAAVISAALEFEKNAVTYYQNQAGLAQSDGEKTLFEWLTKWEKTHLRMLADIDAELKQKIWYDNQFWPAD